METKVKSIYLEPVKKIVQDVLNTNNKEIFLVGKIGSGKTTIINELATYKNVVNISLNYEEYRLYLNKNIYNLYYIALIMQKICQHFLLLYPKVDNDILVYSIKLNNLLQNLKAQYLAYTKLAYFNKIDNLNIDIVNNPHTLITTFYNIIKDKIDLNQFLFVFDNFDKIKNSYNYQNLIFNSLKENFKVLYAVSQINLNDESLKNSKVINLCYSEDSIVIEEILDRYILNKKLITGNDFSKRIRFILNREDISSLIIKTNGNIYLMFYIITLFYNRLNDINMNKIINDYHSLFLECLNIDLVDYKKLKRTLILK